MLLFFTAAPSFDAQKELASPLSAAKALKKHELLFPTLQKPPFDAHGALKASDIVFAEVSAPSLEVGLHLGWASATFIPIVCVSKKGTTLAPMLKDVSKFFIEYDSPADLATKVADFMSRIVFEE